MNGQRDWTATRLWRTLEADAAPAVQQTLRNALPEMETVLRSGGTAPLDFTLHDDGHAFRVAERMVALAPEPANLSDLERGTCYSLPTLTISEWCQRGRRPKHIIITYLPGMRR